MDAKLGFYFRPEVCFQGHLNLDKVFEACLSLHYGTPKNYFSFVPWVQRRNLPPFTHTWVISPSGFACNYYYVIMLYYF